MKQDLLFAGDGTVLPQHNSVIPTGLFMDTRPAAGEDAASVGVPTHSPSDPQFLYGLSSADDSDGAAPALVSAVLRVRPMVPLLAFIAVNSPAMPIGVRHSIMNM